jgi:hypothetical protein
MESTPLQMAIFIFLSIFTAQITLWNLSFTASILTFKSLTITSSSWSTPFFLHIMMMSSVSINLKLLHDFPGEKKIFQRVDSVDNEGTGEREQLIYPTEYLNRINTSGLPLSHLKLKWVHQ